jgi:hypothetical protein
VHVHAEDVWGNVTKEDSGLSVRLKILKDSDEIIQQQTSLEPTGWDNVVLDSIVLPTAGQYMISAEPEDREGVAILSTTAPLTATESLAVPKLLSGDLHVHSDDTVGTEDSTYNFSYGRDVSGLDVLGYTANDIQITKARWDATVQLIQSMNKPGSFVIFPGTEWCGNSAVGSDHNVVFLGDPHTQPLEFPFDRHGNVARSFEWSEDGPKELVPGAWPLDEVYATYAPDTQYHLLFPHVGGRRCNLALHHPLLERLVEISSAWGQFE